MLRAVIQNNLFIALDKQICFFFDVGPNMTPGKVKIGEKILEKKLIIFNASIQK